MFGWAIKIVIKAVEIKALLKQIQQRSENTTPVMKTIGQIIRTSVVRNFEKGGRPKWAGHSSLTEALRGAGKPVLRKQGMAGGLMGSMHVRATNDEVIVGTDKVYAGTHQYGAEKGSFGTFTFAVKSHQRKGRQVKAHNRTAKLPWGDIPARPFLMVQDEDWTEIKAALKDHLLEVL
jgi:phage virion morphogenesis protein